MLPQVVFANDGQSPWLFAYPSVYPVTTGQPMSQSTTAADYHSTSLTVTTNWADGQATSQVVTGKPWNCTIGDGGCYTFLFDFSHTWQKAGSYTVILTLTDTQSYSTTYTFTFTVTDPTCTNGGTYPNCYPAPVGDGGTGLPHLQV